jgi:hypothetical protein
VSYKDVPHAAVNELMKWVRKQGKQVVSLSTWSHRSGWSSLPDWSAHINVRSTKPLHARIKRKGYKFAIVVEPNATDCPDCDAARAVSAALIAPETLVEVAEPAFVTQ